MWVYSSTVLLLSLIFFLLFPNIAWVPFYFWPVIVKELWTKGLRPLSWVELLFYQWIHMVRVAFHGCITLHGRMLKVTCHLSPCHIISAIKRYNWANLTASCYQNRRSHSSFPLCFHPIPGCTILPPSLIFVWFCHWCDLSVSQFSSLGQQKSTSFFQESSEILDSQFKIWLFRRILYYLQTVLMALNFSIKFLKMLNSRDFCGFWKLLYIV